MAAQKGTLSTRYGAESVDVELTQEQKNEASVEVLSGPKYVMSTQPSEVCHQFGFITSLNSKSVCFN